MTPRSRLAALALALSSAAAAPARAETKSDAFAGRIPPISGQLYQKAGRFEVALTGNLSFTDAFFTKYFAGAKVGYHLTESWSAALQVATGTAVASGSAVRCTRLAGCDDAPEWMLYQVPGRIRRIAGAEVAWAPIYGKVSLVGEKVAHFDLSAAVGVDAISHDRVLSGLRPASGGLSEAEALAASGGSPDLETTVGGHVGLGARLFLAEWVALRFEVKDYIYAVEVPNAGAGTDLQNQFFTEIGLSFFLPTHNRPTR